MRDPQSAPGPEGKGLASQIWNLLGSLKFAVGVILLIAAASVYGAMIPQAEAADRVWHTLWYRALMGIVLLSAVVCTADRFEGLFKRVRSPRIGVSTKVYQSLRGFKRARVEGTIDEALHALRRHFRQRRYRVLTEASGTDEVSVLARRGVWRLFGAPIIHVSLVILIIATIWGVSPSLGSYRQVIQIREGEFTFERRSATWIGCDDFEIIYSRETLDEPTHGSVQTYYKAAEYISRVTFYEEALATEAERFVETIPETEAGKGADWPFTLAVEASRSDRGPVPTMGGSIVGLRAVHKAEIKVNRPAHFRGYDYYQQSCDIRAVRVTVTTGGGMRETHTIPLRLTRDRGLAYQPSLIPLLVEDPPDDAAAERGDRPAMSGRMVGVTAFAQRYENGMALTAGQHLAPSPAVRVEELTVSEQGQVMGRELGWIKQGESMTIGTGRLSFDETIYDTVLEVRRQPGVWLLMVGFAVCGIGLILAFWVPLREVRAKVIHQGDSVEVLLGMPRSYRGDDAAEITSSALKAVLEACSHGSSPRRIE